MNSFEADFLIEVEAHAEKRAPAHPIQKAWNPLSVAAPERHLACATPLGLPFEAVCYQLLRNEAFQQLESILHLDFGTAALRPCLDFVDNEKSREKEQVWLFGYRWLSIYYEELLNVETLRSEFYRKYHSAFLDLLRSACEPSPVKRPTFQQLLEASVRLFAITPTPTQTAQLSAEQKEPDASVSPRPTHDLPPVVSAESHAAVVPVVAVKSGCRLVLNGRVCRVERNKTRRNFHN